MSKPIPSIQQLYTKLVTDIKNSLGILAALVKFVINALSGVLAAQLKLLYLYLNDIQNNQFPDTADTAANGGTLERQGRIYLNRDPFPATDGVYTATVTGVTGSVIDAQTTFLSDGGSNSPGNLYVIDNAYTLPDVTGTITIRALNNGLAYLLNVGDTLTPTAPILGVDTTVTILSVATSPIDAEPTEVYRQAILRAIRMRSQWGTRGGYMIASSDANGVRRVYPYVKNGEAGTVQVYVEAVTADSTDGNGTPSGALLTEVEAVIIMDPDTTLPPLYRTRILIQANLEVLPVTPIPVDVTITGLQTTSPTITASISSNLKTYLYAIRPYISGPDLPRDQNNILTAVRLQSVVNDTIGNSNTFLAFTMAVNGVPVNIFTFSLANIPYLRNVTYN